MPINKGPSTPPPMIGKIGPYTVFMTPPSTPSPKPPPPTTSNESTLPVFDSPKKVVSPPPQQIDKSVYSQQVSDGSVLGFFKNAVNKVQNAHSSLDDHLARWLGLNQSKYQWALDDYYETKGLWIDCEGLSCEDCYTLIHSLAYQFKEVVALNRLDMLFSPLGFVIAEAGAPAKCLAYFKKNLLGSFFGVGKESRELIFAPLHSFVKESDLFLQILFWLFSYDAYVALTLLALDLDILMIVHEYLMRNASGCLKGPLCKFLGYALLNSLLAAAAYRELFVH
ncbi:hypothetical protein POTOM_056214 [Populus tomentosa]|uniref:Hydroxyproline-rich glycoprotein family protein n=1 Tax=Populus tomentosa TaxID=118781 RepID=A0A8X7XY88_POPTO|nr:hypothetical protein POTOM_056214 [Populus tomentosa]